MASYSSYPSDDTYLNNNSGNTNYGGSTIVQAYNNGSGSQRRALLLWNLSSVPSVAKVSNVNLKMHQIGGPGSGEVEYIYRVKQSWSEYGVTWNSGWTTAGCYDPTYDLDTTSIASFTQLTDSDRNCTLPDSLITNWLTGGYTNAGILIATASGGAGLGDFGSKDNGTASYRPVLSFDYDIPVAPGAMILGLFEWYKKQHKLMKQLINHGAIPLGRQELLPI